MANKQLVVLLVVALVVVKDLLGIRNLLAVHVNCKLLLQVVVAVVVAACSLINYGLSPVFACRSKLKLDVALYHAPLSPLAILQHCTTVRSEPVVCGSVAASAAALVAGCRFRVDLCFIISGTLHDHLRRFLFFFLHLLRYSMAKQQKNFSTYCTHTMTDTHMYSALCT